MGINSINSDYKIIPINPIVAISDQRQNSPNYFNRQQTKQTTPDNRLHSKDTSDIGLHIDIFA